MKKLIPGILLFFMASSCFSQNKDIEAIKQLNHDWIYAYPKNDTATMARIFADDLVLVSPGGAKMTKRNILENVVKQHTISIQIDSAEVRLLSQDVGIITAWIRFVIKDNGKETPGRNCYQDVYVKRKGRWLAVAAHVTLLNMK